MTTAATTRLQLPAVPAVTLGRDTWTEARKLVDTRAARALLAAAAVLTAGAALATAMVESMTVLDQVVAFACWPASLMLLVLSTLLVTSEFSTGTAAVTFALEPRRSRVLIAKTLVVVAATVVFFGYAVLVSVLAALVSGPLFGHALPVVIEGPRLAAAGGSLLFSALAGLAWGLLTRSAPAPLVVLLAWPTVSMLAGAFSATAANVLGYLDLQAPLAFITDPSHAVARVVVSAAAWIVVPGALGAWRLLRSDLN